MSATEDLKHWFEQNGGYLSPSVSIAKDVTMGVHLRSNAAVTPGTHICTVPHSLGLSYLNALADDKFTVFKTQKHRFKIENIGFFYLMAQYVNRSTSFWKSYLDTLPQPDDGHTTPLWFSEADMQWLEGTDVQFTATERLAIYRQYYATGIEVLGQSGVDTAPYTW